MNLLYIYTLSIYTILWYIISTYGIYIIDDIHVHISYVMFNIYVFYNFEENSCVVFYPYIYTNILYINFYFKHVSMNK